MVHLHGTLLDMFGFFLGFFCPLVIGKQHAKKTLVCIYLISLDKSNADGQQQDTAEGKLTMWQVVSHTCNTFTYSV